MGNNEFWKVCIKNRKWYYFHDIIRLDDLIKLHDNILIYDISYKILIGSKPFRIRFDEINGFIRTYEDN